MRTYTAVELCAGIGGFNLAGKQTGRIDTVWASEIDSFAQKTYSANHKATLVGDITSVSPKEIPDHEICFAGLPCQSYSQAGNQRGLDDARGQLFYTLMSIIGAKRPAVVMFENVPNIQKVNGGKDFAFILNCFKQLGYHGCYTVLSAKDFGVPQLRRRLFCVAFNPEKVKDCLSFQFPLPTHQPTRVGDILELSVPEKYTISDRAWEYNKERKAFNLSIHRGFGYSLVTPDSPYTNTILARYYKDGSEALLAQEGKNPRRLTPREIARLQGYPDSFVFPVSDTQAYKQLGNSVAIPVVRAIEEKIVEFLDSHLM